MSPCNSQKKWVSLLPQVNSPRSKCVRQQQQLVWKFPRALKNVYPYFSQRIKLNQLGKIRNLENVPFIAPINNVMSEEPITLELTLINYHGTVPMNRFGNRILRNT